MVNILLKYEPILLDVVTLLLKWGGLGGTCVRKIGSVRNSIPFSFVLSDGGYDVFVIGIKEKNMNLIKGFNSLEDI